MTICRRNMLLGTSLMVLPSQVGVGKGPNDLIHSIRHAPTRGGRLIEYRVFGCQDLPPVVYFCGCPTTFYELDMNHHSLNLDKYCWVAINRPGIGRSSFDPNLTFDSFAEDMAHVFAELEAKYHWSQYRLLGYSGGVPFALACSRLTDWVSRIALVSSAPIDGAAFSKNALESFATLALNRPWLAKRVLGLFFRIIGRRGITDRMLGFALRQQAFADVDVRLIKECQTLRQSMSRAVAYVPACGVEGIRRELRLLACPWDIDFDRVSTPIDIWHGQLDCNSNFHNSQELHRRTKKVSNLTLFPNEGHLTIWVRQLPHILGQLFCK